MLTKKEGIMYMENIEFKVNTIIFTGQQNFDELQKESLKSLNTKRLITQNISKIVEIEDEEFARFRKCPSLFTNASFLNNSSVNNIYLLKGKSSLNTQGCVIFLEDPKEKIEELKTFYIGLVMYNIEDKNMLNTYKYCQRCNKIYNSYPSESRYGNYRVCSTCGNDEAMEQFVLYNKIRSDKDLLNFKKKYPSITLTVEEKINNKNIKVTY